VEQYGNGEIRGRRRPTEVATMSRAEALREALKGDLLYYQNRQHHGLST